MTVKDILLCKDYKCVKWGTVSLASINIVSSAGGLVIAPFMFFTVSDQLEQFYLEVDENRASELMLKDLPYLWSILALAVLTFVGNLGFSLQLLYTVKTCNIKNIYSWNKWMIASFILFTLLFLLFTIYQGFIFEVMILYLTLIIMNLYQGFLAILLRREMVGQKNMDFIP